MFDTAANQQPLTRSIDWFTQTMLGEVAVALCVIAVAFVGFSMLAGQVSLRRGARVILGCFVLLAAPAMASELLGLWTASDQGAPSPASTVIYEAQPREPLPQATYNPYAGASLRQGSADGGE